MLRREVGKERKRGDVCRGKNGGFLRNLGETLQEGKLKAWEKSLGVSKGFSPREKEKRRSERKKWERFLKKNRENGKEKGS